MRVGPLNGWVLGAAAVLSSPALWLALVEGAVSLDLALTRYLVSVVACWAGLNLLAPLVLPRDDAGRGPAAETRSGPEQPGVTPVAPVAPVTPVTPGPTS